jgi:hypothetical protein
MTTRGDQPYVDTQSLSDADTYVYEAVATLEYSGHRPSREAIAAAASLDDDVLSRILAELTGQGALTVSGFGGEAVYEPARRDWSTRPQQAEGHPLRRSGHPHFRSGRF